MQALSDVTSTLAVASGVRRVARLVAQPFRFEVQHLRYVGLGEEDTDGEGHGAADDGHDDEDPVYWKTARTNETSDDGTTAVAKTSQRQVA